MKKSDAGENTQSKIDADNKGSARPIYESVASQAVKRISDQPFLLVVAIVALIGLIITFFPSALATELRFVVGAIAFMTLFAITIYAVIKIYEIRTKNSQSETINPPIDDSGKASRPSPRIIHRVKTNRENATYKGEKQWSFKDRKKIVDALLLCKTMSDPDARKTIVEHLKPGISGAIRVNERADIHVANIVNTCIAFEGGLEDLLEVVESFEGETVAMQNLKQLFRELQ